MTAATTGVAHTPALSYNSTWKQPWQIGDWSQLTLDPFHETSLLRMNSASSIIHRITCLDIHIDHKNMLYHTCTYHVLR